jgi:hypothetical protein
MAEEIQLQDYQNKKIRESYNVGDLNVQLEIEIMEDHSKYKSKFGDTKVSINNNLLCYVSGQEKDLFIQEFRELINKYRI